MYFCVYLSHWFSGFSGCQVHVRHVCPAVAQQLGHLQLCPVLCSPAIQRFPILPGRIAVPHPVVCQRPGIRPLVRTVLPKERLKSMNIGIRGHIVWHEQLMPPPDGSFSIPQCLFGCCRRHRHAPDTSTLALDRQQSRPLPRLHGNRIKTADLMDAQTDIKGERGNICIVSPVGFPTGCHEGRKLLRRPVPVNPLKLSALQRRLIG